MDYVVIVKEEIYKTFGVEANNKKRAREIIGKDIPWHNKIIKIVKKDTFYKK